MNNKALLLCGTELKEIAKRNYSVDVTHNGLALCSIPESVPRLDSRATSTSKPT